MSVVRAAVIQAASVTFQREKTLEKVRALAADAAREKAQIAVFPGGLRLRVSEGARFRRPGRHARARRARGLPAVLRERRERTGPSGRPCSRRLRSKNKLYLVIGVIERDGGTLYCTILFFSPDGRLMGKHRKLMPTAMERLIWGFGDDSTLPVFETPLGRLGAVICWENYMPLLRTAMYAKGVQLRPSGPSRHGTCSQHPGGGLGGAARGSGLRSDW